MVPLRFELTLNGRRLYLAGLDREGMLMLSIESEHWPSDDPAESVRGTPAGDENTVSVFALTADHEDWRWARERIKAGDEIVVRVLPAGPFDPPTSFGPPEDE